MPTITTKESHTRHRAYQIWEAEGRPYGKDFEHWLRAEAELSHAGNTRVARTAKPKVKHSATKATTSL